MSPITRRVFLQTGVAAGGSALTAKNSAWLVPDRRINFAVIGSNQPAVHHLATLASAPWTRVSLITGNSAVRVKRISQMLREQNLQPPRLSANHEEAFLDPNIDAVCIAGHQLHPTPLLQAAFASGKPVFFDLPPTQGAEGLAQSLTSESRVATCLDGLCFGILPTCGAAAHILGEIHTVVLRMSKPHPTAADRPTQLSMLAALCDAALIAFPLKETQRLDMAGQCEHPIFGKLEIVRTADRTKLPEVILTGSRGQALLAAKPQLPYTFLHNRLLAFINTLATGATPAYEPARRHFQAAALALTIHRSQGFEAKRG